MLLGSTFVTVFANKVEQFSVILKFSPRLDACYYAWQQCYRLVHLLSSMIQLSPPLGWSQQSTSKAMMQVDSVPLADNSASCTGAVEPFKHLPTLNFCTCPGQYIVRIWICVTAYDCYYKHLCGYLPKSLLHVYMCTCVITSRQVLIFCDLLA